MLNIKGSFRYGPGAYKLALQLIANGQIDPRPIVTHRYPFEQAQKAFETMIRGEGEDGQRPVKVLIMGPIHAFKNIVDVTPADDKLSVTWFTSPD